MKRTCAHCGKEFETNKPNQIYCKGPHYRPCPVCGKPVKMIDNDFTRPPKCCSYECSHIKRKQNFKPRKCEICGEEFIPKSGVQLVCEKNHYRNCVICGKLFLIEHAKDTKVTCSQECLTKHLRKESIRKYGVPHPMYLKEVQDKFKATMMDKYGVEHALQSRYLQSKNQQTNISKYGTPYACMLPQCKESPENYTTISKINKSISYKLIGAGIPNQLEKLVGRYSYDIYIPDQNILIEVDPSYTHNVYGNHFNSPVRKDYHRDKTQVAEDNGYRCIHIFDWDDVDKIVDMLMPRKHVYARDCKIYILKSSVTNEFLNRYHLQGTCRGQLMSLGLIYQDELVQVMTFGKSRYVKHPEVELLRLCTKPGVSVVGGASKLFKFFVKTYEVNDVISYCDRSKFSGDVYEKLGMKLTRTTPPQEIWSREYDKITANLLRQRGYDQLFKTNYGKGTSNEQLMLENGWLPVYDCGQKVYQYHGDNYIEYKLV